MRTEENAVDEHFDFSDKKSSELHLRLKELQCLRNNGHSFNQNELKGIKKELRVRQREKWRRWDRKFR